MLVKKIPINTFFIRKYYMKSNSSENLMFKNSIPDQYFLSFMPRDVKLIAAVTFFRS